MLEGIGDVFSVAWLDDDTLVVERHAEGDLEFSLWTVTASGTNLTRITPDHVAGCRIVSYRFPARLPDGRIGAVKDCGGARASDQARTYVAIDPSGDMESTLAPLAPAGERPVYDGVPMQDFNPSAVTWAPDLSYAVITDGNGICLRLGTLDPEGVRGLDAALSNNGPRIDNGLLLRRARSCTSEIRAGNAALSPDGTQLAFAASPESVGIDGPDRLDVPWNIYLRDGDGVVAQVASDVLYNSSIDWSPDGESLLISGGTDGADQGLAILDLQSGRFTRLTAEPAGNASFSPDGRRVAFGTYRPMVDGADPEFRVVVLDLPNDL